MKVREAFLARGWIAFPPDPETAAWAAHAAGRAASALADPCADRRHGGAWHAGVDALRAAPADGRLAPEGPPLGGAAVRFVRDALGFSGTWDPGQLSICRPGYPGRDPGETVAAHRFRVERAAAHVDGLLRVGEGRRRVGERHAFLLGLPLGPEVAGASPLVVWEGSHHRMRAALKAALRDRTPETWGAQDVTDAYVSARRAAFAQDPRRTLLAAAGGAYLLHRLALHGIEPWRAGRSPPRAVAYFRPVFADDASDVWLSAP